MRDVQSVKSLRLDSVTQQVLKDAQAYMLSEKLVELNESEAIRMLIKLGYKALVGGVR